MLVRMCPSEDNASRLKAARPEDFERRLAPAPWNRADVLNDGRRVRIDAQMGPCPLARVEVKEGPRSVVITLFERRPPVLAPDGTPVGIFLIGIFASFDLVLPGPVGRRRLIDGATGFDPRRTKRARNMPELDPSRPRVEVPIGRTFDWKELTGKPWWEVRSSKGEPSPPPATIDFFTSDDPPHRKHQR
jgi:hypothetical protein